MFLISMHGVSPFHACLRKVAARVVEWLEAVKQLNIPIHQGRCDETEYHAI